MVMKNFDPKMKDQILKKLDPEIEYKMYKTWSVRVNDVDYLYLMDKLHYGQLSRLTRLFLAAMVQLIEEGKIQEVLNYLYQTKELTIPLTHASQSTEVAHDDRGKPIQGARV